MTHTRLRPDPDDPTPWETACPDCPPNHVPIQGGHAGMTAHRYFVHHEGERPPGI